MFCRQCGKEVEDGRKFCTFCGAVQDPAAAVGAPPPAQPPLAPGSAGGGKSGGLKPLWIAVIVVVALLVVAGTVLGIYFGVSGGGTPNTKPTLPNGSQGTNPGGDLTTKSEKLVYLDSQDLYSVNMDGTGRVKLTNRADVVDFAVSPEGRRIAFVAAPNASTQRVIFRMLSDGTGEEQVTLPEKGQAENPAFDPSTKYIYFTRVTPEQQANIEAGNPYSVDFERYNIAPNSVDHLYTYGNLQEQSIVGLFANAADGNLYFNLFGSDYPSSVPHKLSINATSVTDSVYMPIQRDTGNFSVVAYQLTGFSRDGAYVTYFKQTLGASTGTGESVSQTVYACYQPYLGGAEVSVASYELSASDLGKISSMQFSSVDNSNYYYSKVTGGAAAGTQVLQYYKGTTGGSSNTNTGPNVTFAVDAQSYTPMTWHLMPKP